MLYVAGKAFGVGALISTITVLASGMAARWRGASDVRYGPRRRVQLLRLRAPDAGDEHHLVGAIALLAINFDTVMATALINWCAGGVYLR